MILEQAAASRPGTATPRGRGRRDRRAPVVGARPGRPRRPGPANCAGFAGRPRRAEPARRRRAPCRGPAPRSRDRAVVVAADRAEAGSGPRRLAEPGRPPTAVRRSGRGAVFVFPGQGAQWVGMGARSARDVAGVRRADAASARSALDPLTGWSLLEVLRGGGSLDAVEVVQPASFAVMVSLAAVWQVVRGGAGRGGRSLAGRDRRRLCGRGVEPGRRRPDRGAA